MDEAGRTVKLSFTNTLISAKFPYKLIALQKFTRKGFCVSMDDEHMRIVNPKTPDTVLVGVRDDKSQLFFLQLADAGSRLVQAHHAEAKSAEELTLLARSYGSSEASDADLLWKLHLRHGHRNFADVARQYGLPVPKTIPACTSCIMGKSHVYPHLSNGFERATRQGEGFHSDFRGPFSVPTPEGHWYLLSIIDDYSRRLFGFLAKTQTEWMDIWTAFVARVEESRGS